MKHILLSLDVEDWFHLDYFNRNECDTRQSLLDGLDEYVGFINHLGIPSNFFVLGEIAVNKLDFFKNLAKEGHDVGSHGWSHARPLTLSVDDFYEELSLSYKLFNEINENQSFGYRAPCFSLDRKRLDIVRECGFSYDSSLIEFGNHPLYGTIDMDGFELISKGVYKIFDFMEFELPTYKIFNNNIPISGGGYLRILPWVLMKKLISSYIQNNNIFVLYIHPFEFFPFASTNTTRFYIYDNQIKIFLW